ncbi:putative peptidase [Aureobasidium sp. EXF-10728]|nr:putative peptidase [Aureobasidium sp. EXF-10728]
MFKAALLDTIDAERQDLINFLQSLTRADSSNPPGDTIAAACVVTTFLASRDVPSTIIAPKSHAPNVTSTFPAVSQSPAHSRSSSLHQLDGYHSPSPVDSPFEGSGISTPKPGPRLVMNGHIDAFPISESEKSQWTHDPWSADIENNRLYGRGVVDMKAGTAATIAAYTYIFAHRHLLNGTAVLEAVSDEETGGKWGSKYLLNDDDRKETWTGDVNLNAEPTGLQSIRFAEKGTLRITFSVKATSAHGAYTHLSEGAIRIAIRLITELVKLEDFSNFKLDPEVRKYLDRQEVRDMIDEIMGAGASNNILKPTVNIGTISGGTKVNTIPGDCKFEAEIRLPIGLVAETILKEIDAILENFPGASYEVQEAASNPPNLCPFDHALTRAIADNAEHILGRKPIAIPSLGATDAKHWRYKGVPAYSYGLSPQGMAGIDESVDLDDYINLVKILTLTAWDFLTGPE